MQLFFDKWCASELVCTLLDLFCRRVSGTLFCDVSPDFLRTRRCNSVAHQITWLLPIRSQILDTGDVFVRSTRKRCNWELCWGMCMIQHYLLHGDRRPFHKPSGDLDWGLESTFNRNLMSANLWNFWFDISARFVWKWLYLSIVVWNVIASCESSGKDTRPFVSPAHWFNNPYSECMNI